VVEDWCRGFEETTPSDRRRLLRRAVRDLKDGHAKEGISQSSSNALTSEETIRDILLLVLSDLEKARDEGAAFLAQLQWLIEKLRRETPDTYEPPAHQVARDDFILDRYKRDTKISVIRSRVNSHPGWRSLGTDSAVRLAMVRHCQRLGIKIPKRK
jgi:hypothetical protein